MAFYLTLKGVPGILCCFRLEEGNHICGKHELRVSVTGIVGHGVKGMLESKLRAEH